MHVTSLFLRPVRPCPLPAQPTDIRAAASAGNSLRLLPALFLFALVLLLPCTACAKSEAPTEPRNPLWAQSVPLEHAENFYRIAPGMYRSAQPDRKAMKSYAAMGIRTIINLRNNHDDNDEAAGTNLILRRIPINTWNITDEQVITLLVMLRTEERPILIHCLHGADRTGLMTAMYRIIEQGWSKEEALQELREGGYGFHSIWRNIPRYIQEVDIQAIRAAVDARAPKREPERAPAQEASGLRL